MIGNELELSDIFNLPEWGKLLKSLSDAFGVAISMTDLKNANIVEPVGISGFCRSVLCNPRGKRLCMKCVTLGGLEAMRTNKPFIAHCHTGVSFGCVPVMVQGRYMGLICFGQVRVKGESAEHRSMVINGTRSMLSDGENDTLKNQLSGEFLALPELENDKLVKIGNVIWNLTNYMVDRIVSLKSENRSYEWVLQNALSPFIETNDPVVPEISTFPVPEIQQIYPALVYIDEHPERAISMHDMADLCKLSHSYFSKVFLRDVGVNFTDYVVSKKIERAKFLLTEGSMSVAEIADALGFTDTSYFIKVFKKSEGTTPLAYRQAAYLQK